MFDLLKRLRHTARVTSEITAINDANKQAGRDLDDLIARSNRLGLEMKTLLKEWRADKALQASKHTAL